MRVMITGSSGFIGQHLMKAFPDAIPVDLKTGHNIEDRFVIGKMVAHHEPEVIIHLAARSNIDECRTAPHRAFDVNVNGTVNILEAAQRVGAHVILASTAGAIKPGLVGDRSLPRPHSVYGATKAAAEAACYAFQAASHVPVTIARLANVYGPGDGNSSRLIPALCHAAATLDPINVRGNGSTWRDFVYIDDVVKAFKALADAPPCMAMIGSGVSISVQDIIVRFQIATAKQVPAKYIDPIHADEFQISGIDPDALDWFRSVVPDPVGLNDGLLRTWRAYNA